MDKKTIVTIGEEVCKKWYGVLIDTVAMYNDGSCAIVFAVDTDKTVEFVTV